MRNQDPSGITDAEFAQFQRLIYQIAGISLADSKKGNFQVDSDLLQDQAKCGVINGRRQVQESSEALSLW